MKRISRHDTSARRGSVLIIALMVTMGIAMLGACLLQFSTSTTRSQIQGVDKKRAFYLAESGLSEALYGLMQGESGNVGTATAPARFGDGVMWVEASRTADGRVVLDSTGLCGGGRASLSIVVEKTSVAPATLGIFSDSDLVVKSGSVIDMYDSSRPADPATSTNCVGSNGNIDVQGSKSAVTKIEGDVTPGPTGTVTSASGVTIGGSTAPRAAPIVLPPIMVPELEAQGSLATNLLVRKLTVGSGNHRYERIDIGAAGQLTLRGPQTLVVQSLTLQPGAKLVLDTKGGDVDIHVTDYMNLAALSSVECVERIPGKLHFEISASRTLDRDGDGVDDPPVTLLSSGKLYGTLFAPSAQVSLSSGLELFGAVTAKRLVLSQGARLHFDQALLDRPPPASGSVKLVSWRVLEIPDTPLASLRVDPLTALRQQGATLLPPAECHQEIEFKIKFIDQGLAIRVWEGEESKFDWSQVLTVLRVAREGDALFDEL